MHIKEPLFFGANFNFFSNNLFQSTRLRLEVWKETDIFNSHSEKKKKKEKRSDRKKGEEHDGGNGGGKEIGEEEKW